MRPNDTQTELNTAILLRSQAAGLLRDGVLGSRLVQSAHIAAAIHMAQTASVRSDVAQDLRRPEAPR